MKDSKISTAAASASRRNLHQVKKGGEDRHSRIGVAKSVLRHRICWYVAFKREKVSPLIKWKCPPTFGMDPCWQVAAGDESHEANNQKCRETTVSEALYPCLSAIPPSPFTDPGAEGECYDDARTPVIPLIPIEDVAEESGSKTTAGEETGVQQLINIVSDPEMVKKLMDGMQQKVRPPTPSTSAHVAVMSVPDATTTVLPTKPSTSKPDVEAIRKLIHDYGRRPQYASMISPPMAHMNAPWNRPSMIASTSYRPSNVEDFRKTISICGVDHRWGKPYTGQHPSMFLPVTNHHEIEEQRLSRFGQHQGLRSTHSYPTSFVTNPKPRQETCIYFGSSRGCRNGSKCRFIHHVSKKTMANR